MVRRALPPALLVAAAIACGGCSLLIDIDGQPLGDEWDISPLNGHAYQHVGFHEWADAVSECANEYGGHLATASNRLEEEFILTLVEDNGAGTWVGFYCDPLPCKWIDDTPFPDDPPWLAGNDPERGTGPCGEFFGGRWASSLCEQDLNTVCEIDL